MRVDGLRAVTPRANAAISIFGLCGGVPANYHGTCPVRLSASRQIGAGARGERTVVLANALETWIRQYNTREVWNGVNRNAIPVVKTVELGSLDITGDISVEPVQPTTPIPSYAYLYLLMGPTGAGKSSESFIEALGGKQQPLSISSNQLAEYTQSVNAYRLVNVTRQDRPVYPVDTPSFSNSKFSEIEIVTMVESWRLVAKNPFFDANYGTEVAWKPASDNRNAQSAFVDTLYNDRTQKRAESNFAQMRDDICKDFVRPVGNLPFSFTNTRIFALEAMNDHIKYATIFETSISWASGPLYQDLHERIESALQKMQTIEFEISQVDEYTNADLKAVLKKNKADKEGILENFIEEFNSVNVRSIDDVEDSNSLPASPPSIDIPPDLDVTLHDARSSIQESHLSPLAVQAQHIIDSVDPRSSIRERNTTKMATPEEPVIPLPVIYATHDEWGKVAPADLATLRPDPIPDHHPPTSTLQMQPSRMLLLKELTHRLVQVARSRGRKWFRKRAL
ncbi:hypothetical protein BJ165DRAFT_1599129 [Panaeolus papilionaceus]|nr:hypothetical protein BJ165DRAFT_1599129 [Panaeolus papilionaceus]